MKITVTSPKYYTLSYLSAISICPIPDFSNPQPLMPQPWDAIAFKARDAISQKVIRRWKIRQGGLYDTTEHTEPRQAGDGVTGERGDYQEL